MKSIVWDGNNVNEVLSFVEYWLNNQPDVQKGWVEHYYCSIELSEKENVSILWLRSKEQKRMFLLAVGTIIQKTILPFGLNRKTRWITTDYKN